MLGTAASSIWQCTPVPRAWDRSLPGTCISLTANWYANAAFSITTDVLIILLPQKVIWESQLPGGQKKALMAVFALGGFVTVTSVLRMTTLNFSTTSPDVTCTCFRRDFLDIRHADISSQTTSPRRYGL